MRAEAIKKAKARIEKALADRDEAEVRIDDAKAAYRAKQQARLRVNDVMTVVNVHFAETPAAAEDAAEPYVRCLLSGLLWEQNGDRQFACQFVSNVFPGFPHARLAELASKSHAMTSQDVARALGVTLEFRQQYGLAMVGACDLTDDEYDAFKKTERKRRHAARARRARANNIDQRRATEKAKRDAIAAFAEANDKAEKTIRNWLTAGKISLVIDRENGMSTIVYTPDHATFPKSAVVGGGLKASRQTSTALVIDIDPAALDHALVFAEAARRRAAMKARASILRRAAAVIRKAA